MFTVNILTCGPSWSSSHWPTRGAINGLLLGVHFTCRHFNLEVAAFPLPQFLVLIQSCSLYFFGHLNGSLQEGVQCRCSDYHLEPVIVSRCARLKVPPRKSGNLAAATNNSRLALIKTKKVLSDFTALLVCELEYCKRYCGIQVALSHRLSL